MIKLKGYLVFMVAIQCFAKADLYLSAVYPPKRFSYHLLTEYHHQYLKERVFNNFAVKRRKSWTPENFKEWWLRNHKVRDTWANLKGVRSFQVFFSFKKGGAYNWNRKSDSKQNTFCIYWFLTKLQNVMVEALGRAYHLDGHFFLFTGRLAYNWGGF